MSKPAKKPMTLQERILVNSLIEYPERPNSQSQEPQPIEQPVAAPSMFECDVGEFKAVALLKVGSAHNSWSSIILTIKDGQVIDVSMSEPDMKVISQEQSKIDYINNVCNPKE